MRSHPNDRRLRVALILGTSWALLTGCGSGVPADGTQINVTIPKEEAAKQNEGYKQYAKQGRAGPAGGSANQRNRNRR